MQRIRTVLFFVEKICSTKNVIKARLGVTLDDPLQPDACVTPDCS